MRTTQTQAHEMRNFLLCNENYAEPELLPLSLYLVFDKRLSRAFRSVTAAHNFTSHTNDLMRFSVCPPRKTLHSCECRQNYKTHTHTCVQNECL